MRLRYIAPVLALRPVHRRCKTTWADFDVVTSTTSQVAPEVQGVAGAAKETGAKLSNPSEFRTTDDATEGLFGTQRAES